MEAQDVHLKRWWSSLSASWGSPFVDALERPTSVPIPIRPALDAAVGIAEETARLQEEYLGLAWTQRVARFDDFVKALRLPEQPPPGTPVEVWAAVRRIYEAPDPGQGAAAEFREELAIIDQFRVRHPRRCEQVLVYADNCGEALDEEERPHTLAEKHALDTGTAFRAAWLRVFPRPHRGRAASVHLAVAILEPVFGSVRPTALFLEHCGLLTARLVSEQDPRPGGDPLAIDSEVRNARKAWRRLGHRQGPNHSALHLVSMIEALTSERLRGAPGPSGNRG